MCCQVIERYSACRCIYYLHSIDPCGNYGKYGHQVQQKTVLVGYSCQSHFGYPGSRPSSRLWRKPDSSGNAPLREQPLKELCILRGVKCLLGGQCVVSIFNICSY